MTELRSVRSFPLVNGRRVLPDGVTYIGRAVPRVGLAASPWGNPFRVGGRLHPDGHPEQHVGSQVLPWSPCRCEPLSDLREVFWAYRGWLELKLLAEPHYLEPLRGRVLACWCERRAPSEPMWCHGTAILEALEIHRPEPRPGERIEFGVHAMPSDEAEAAPAWPPLATMRGRANARHTRELKKAAS